MGWLLQCKTSSFGHNLLQVAGSAACLIKLMSSCLHCSSRQQLLITTASHSIFALPKHASNNAPEDSVLITIRDTPQHHLSWMLMHGQVGIELGLFSVDPSKQLLTDTYGECLSAPRRCHSQQDNATSCVNTVGRAELSTINNAVSDST